MRKHLIHAVKDRSVQDSYWETPGAAYKAFLFWRERGYSVDWADLTAPTAEGQRVVAYTENGKIMWNRQDLMRKMILAKI